MSEDKTTENDIEEKVFDLNADAVKANFMKVEFFAMLCQKCGYNHLFFVNHQGQPVFLLGFDHEAEDTFLQKHGLERGYLQKNSLIICGCGLPLRISNDQEVEEAEKPVIVRPDSHLKPV